MGLMTLLLNQHDCMVLGNPQNHESLFYSDAFSPMCFIAGMVLIKVDQVGIMVVGSWKKELRVDGCLNLHFGIDMVWERESALTTSPKLIEHQVVKNAKTNDLIK